MQPRTIASIVGHDEQEKSSFNSRTCKECTLINTPHVTLCDVCETPCTPLASNTSQPVPNTSYHAGASSGQPIQSSIPTSSISVSGSLKCHAASPPPLRVAVSSHQLAEQAQQCPDQLPTEWECQVCTFSNIHNDKRCIIWHEGTRPERRRQIMRIDPVKPVSFPATPRQTSTIIGTVLEYIVYIPDLPADINAAELERMIDLRLNSNHHIFDQKTKQTEIAAKVARRWAQLSKSPQLPPCERISVLFPNIFKITSRSLGELLAIRTLDIFKVNEQFANVYLRVDYSFVEDLPENITTTHITTAINTHNGDEKLIIELNDRSVYDQCLAVSALRVHDCPAMTIDPFTVILNDPKNIEIDADNWYEMEKLDIKRPDIKQFVVTPEHPIFKYKWNAQNWLEQFERVKGVRDQQSDRKRHLLRITTMLNTIGVIHNKSYTVETGGNKKEIKFKFEQLKTIAYNHRSKLPLSKGMKSVLKSPYQFTTVEVGNNDRLLVYEKLAADKSRPVLLNMANATTSGGGYRQGAGA
ncbi:unnamed protein product [Rotaria socialis]